MSNAMEIWNRAALEAGGTHPLPGDAALAALLAFHNLVMNAGVGHGFEVLDAEERRAAIAGYRYFGFEGVAQHLEKAEAFDEEQREALNPEYDRLIPSDGALVAAFESLLAEAPEQFAPLQRR